MPILKEIPPTAGFPLYFSDLMPFSSPGSLENDFNSYLGTGYCRITYSGTAALYIILQSLKEISSKRTVIIPSFVCPLVPLAVKRAGLNVEVCDINGSDFNFNIEELEKLCSSSNDILAVIPAHLAGIPLDLQVFAEMIKSRGIFLIEDCAQSLGAEYNGKKVGALGDFSFFSLCRGKGLTIYEGGAIVSNRSEFNGVIDKKIQELVKADYFSETLKIFELFGYWLFYRPALFWFVFRLPKIFWRWRNNEFRAEIEYFDINFPSHKVSGYRKSVGHSAFSRIEEELQEQKKKADYYIKGLDKIKGVKPLKQTNNAVASYPYFVALFEDAVRREKALKVLDNLGLGVSRIYTAAITGYDYLKGIVPQKSCPQGELFAARHIAFSTNKFMNSKDIDSVIDVIKNLDNI